MIRAIEFGDVPKVVNYLKQKHAIFNITENEALAVDSVYGNNLIGRAHLSGCSFVSTVADEITGVALGIETPNVWIPAHKELYMLALYSDNKITGGKLFLKWEAQAKDLLRSGTYKRIMVDEVIGETNINYQSCGFTPLRKTFIMEA